MPDIVPDLIFGVAVVLCAVAQVFILRAVLIAPSNVKNERSAKADTFPATSRPMEITWVLIPALMLAGVSIWAWQLRHPELPSASLPAASAPVSPEIPQ